MRSGSLGKPPLRSLSPDGVSADKYKSGSHRNKRVGSPIWLGCFILPLPVRAAHVFPTQDWVIVDLVGKGGWIRTVPVPNWCKRLVDVWLRDSGVNEETAVVMTRFFVASSLTSTTIVGYQKFKCQ